MPAATRIRQIATAQIRPTSATGTVFSQPFPRKIRQNRLLRLARPKSVETRISGSPSPRV